MSNNVGVNSEIVVNSQEERDEIKILKLGQGYVLVGTAGNSTVLKKEAKQVEIILLIASLLLCFPVFIYFMIMNSKAKDETLTLKLVQK